VEPSPSRKACNYLKIWDLLHPEIIKLAGLVTVAFLLLIFPEILIARARRLWQLGARNVPAWLRRSPKPTGSGQARRSNACYYELIGPCYVHGMMNGEAIEFQNEKQIKAEVFELR
jgi:hypothetical protein